MDEKIKKSVSKAQMRATKKYNDNNYERLELRVKKGEKQDIKDFAEKIGESANEFVNKAIKERMERLK